MKILTFLAMSLLFFETHASHNNATLQPPRLRDCIAELNYTLKTITSHHKFQISLLQKKHILLESKFLETNDIRSQIWILREQMSIQDHYSILEKNKSIKKCHVRYEKGIEIIRALYEKILALDHHYTSLQTLHSIQRMTNPNNFPDYVKSRERILAKQVKKNKLNLNGILGDNLYTNIMHSLFNLFSAGQMNNERKIKELQQLECIIDFTLKMNSDLNTISFEMDFLKKANEDLKSGLENLFIQYLKPLDYSNSIQHCRTNDSWDELKAVINEKFKDLEIKDVIIYNSGIDDELSNYKFSIDQLYFFIHRYDQIINQSISFYKKFEIMIDNYQISELCVDRIPAEFISLKENIDITIEKFHEAYNPAELYGSQLKQLLYGD